MLLVPDNGPSLRYTPQRHIVLLAAWHNSDQRRKALVNRPRVVVHAVASVDGRITLAPDVLLLYGDERWQAVAGSSDQVYERLKFTYRPQVFLEGSGSFVPTNAEPEPLPPVDGDSRPLYQDFLPDDVVHRPGHQGWFTAVDSRGRVRWSYKEFEGWEGWHLLVLVAQNTPPEYLAYLQRKKIPYLVAGEERVDLHTALEKLGSQLGVTCVVSTAGGKLDEISIEFFPAVISGFETPSLFDAPALKPDEWPTRLKLISAQVQAEGRVWLRYEVVAEHVS
jgi:2,5-diamino-6-(ribosylamino)-4(3H)-pyrimidinone 5'-phosphate reductase